MSIDYDPALVEQVSYNLDLREPNQQAFDALAKALDTAEPGAEFIADLATGVGKTYIAGGLLDYLYESGVRNVLIGAMIRICGWVLGGAGVRWRTFPRKI